MLHSDKLQAYCDFVAQYKVLYAKDGINYAIYFLLFIYVALTDSTVLNRDRPQLG